MIVLAFILILLIGFLLFNPFKVNQDMISGQNNNSFMGFFMFCTVCIGLLCYFNMSENGNFIGKLADFDFFRQENIPQETPANTEEPKQEEHSQKNYIDFDAFSSEKQLPIVEMSDYDGFTKKQLFFIRKNIVDNMGGLGGKDYQPSEEIFGRIQDRKPWWGTEGILCKGQGQHASDGMSRESSYFNNPFILLNLGLGRVMNGNRGRDNEYLISKKDLAKQYAKYEKNTLEGQIIRCFYDGKKETALFKQIAYIGKAWGKRSNDYIDFGELVDGLGIDRSTVNEASISLKDIQDRLIKADSNVSGKELATNTDPSGKVSVSQLFVILGGKNDTASTLLKIADEGSKAGGGTFAMADCSGLWPQPTELVVYPQEKTIKVKYNLSGFMKEFEGTDFYESVNKADWFEFASTNARDFGYTYAQAYETSGIRFANTPNVSSGARLRNYWCLGQSCQIEGGCNNICPSNDPFTFYVDSYPAYAKFKLYKTEQTSGSEPDAYFEIQLN